MPKPTSISVPKSSILFARSGVWKIRSVACGFNSIKIEYSDYPKSLISRINEVYVFFNKISTIKPFVLLFCCNHTCYCVNMVPVTSASRYITSASRYYLRYQSRFSVHICGLIPRNFAEFAKAVPIDEANVLQDDVQARMSIGCSLM